MPLGGYVLAGGRSSRMGRDKALLELGGRPLIAHAVAKIRSLTGDARILAGESPGNPSLSRYAPLVFDRVPGCGPVGGIEAALADSAHDWNLILPVDVPFLPQALLARWIARVTRSSWPSVSVLEADGVTHPTILLVRRATLPFLTDALDRCDLKVYPALVRAAQQAAPPGAALAQAEPLPLSVDQLLSHPEETLSGIPQALWFANLNTPEQFAEAERLAAASLAE